MFLINGIKNAGIWLWNQGTFSVPNITNFRVRMRPPYSVTGPSNPFMEQDAYWGASPWSFALLYVFGVVLLRYQYSSAIFQRDMIYCAGGRICLSFKHSCRFIQPSPVSSEGVLRGLSLRNRVYFNPTMYCSVLVPVLVVSWEPRFMENPIRIKGCMNYCLVLDLEPISWGCTANPYISILSRVCYLQTLWVSLNHHHHHHSNNNNNKHVTV